MIRCIAGFHHDAEGDWVAELSCFHSQHIRHRPPFQPRAWVLDAKGRDERIGTDIECPLCDRAELPADLVVHDVLGPWSEEDVPGGLRRVHRTPPERWGRLRVLHGAVDFRFLPGDATPGDATPGDVRHIAAPAEQAIPPDVAHQVVLVGPVRLQLELLGPPSDGPAS